MILLYLVQFMLVVLHRHWWKDPERFEKCWLFKDKLQWEVYFGGVVLLKTIGWFGVIQLLIYQYRKGLSEEWYSHKLFWFLNVLVDAAAIGYGTYTNNYSFWQYLFGSV